jgi:hypothetical protein
MVAVVEGYLILLFISALIFVVLIYSAPIVKDDMVPRKAHFVSGFPKETEPR